MGLLSEDLILAWVGAILLVVIYFGYLFNAKKINGKYEEYKRKKEFQKIMAEHPEWAATLNSESLEEQKKVEKEKKDREEFERLAKEHPDWL
ncbi:MAG: hypothetical protein J6K84_04505 [Oscillospiraceae bacterium]|nr:hypothetical protein [Oscillospiraceae bacterium]